MKKLNRKNFIVISVFILLIVIACLLAYKFTSTNSDKLVELEKEGMYSIGKHYFKSLYPLDESSVELMAKKLNKIYDMYLQNHDNVYFAVVPDKSYYVKDYGYPTLDYDRMIDILNENINENIEYIEIKDTLSLDDYFYTDNHWKQEKLIDTVNRIGEYLDFKISKSDFKKVTYDSFRGYYMKYLENDTITEKLHYLVNEHTDSAIVENHRNPYFNKVYDEIKLNTEIQYDVFLSGVSPIIKITNKMVNNGKELIIFRDSFASCLTPLIISEYQKITLVDVRYLMTSLLNNYIEFNNQDVLFLYNSGVVNKSKTLR